MRRIERLTRTGRIGYRLLKVDMPRLLASLRRALGSGVTDGARVSLLRQGLRKSAGRTSHFLDLVDRSTQGGCHPSFDLGGQPCSHVAQLLAAAVIEARGVILEHEQALLDEVAGVFEAAQSGSHSYAARLVELRHTIFRYANDAGLAGARLGRSEGLVSKCLA